MKSEIKLYSYLNNFKNILKLVLFANLIFLFIYNLYLHPIVIRITSTKKYNIDIEYYKGIFDNLEYANIIAILIILLTFFRYEIIKNRLINTLKKNNLLFFCIISNVIIQLLILLFITPEPISDSKYYIEHANLLYKSGSYINSYGNLTAFWPVGLPAYLAFLKSFSPSFTLIARLINILISTGLILVCYTVFKKYLTPASLNLYLIIFTFFPNNLLSSNIILTDYPFTFFLWASILMLLKMNEKSSLVFPVLMGIFCALASYLRPIGIVLPFIFSGIILIQKYPVRGQKSVILLTVFLVAMIPWGLRNFNLFHAFLPVSSNGGYIFLMGNHKDSGGGVNFDFKYNISNPNEGEESKNAYYLAYKDIYNNPFESLIRIPKKILQTYYRGDSSITWGFKQTWENVPVLFTSILFYLTNMIFYLIIMLNIYVVFLFWKWNSVKKYFELLIISIYFIITLIIFVGSERYHIPLLPIHIFLTSKYFENRSKKSARNII